MAIENTGQFEIYHVLGKISPIEGVGPNQLKHFQFGERSENLEEWLGIILR